MTIKPTRDNVLIERIEPPNISKGGIILPYARAKGLYWWGRVVSVGPKCYHVKPGMRVRYTKLLGWEIDGFALVKEGICDVYEE